MKWHHFLQEIPFSFCFFFYLAVVLLSIQSLFILLCEEYGKYYLLYIAKEHNDNFRF